MSERIESDQKQSRVTGWLWEQGMPHTRFGVIHTPVGSISVHVREHAGGAQNAHFDTVVGGRRWHMTEKRSADRRLTERGIKILAHRWIRTLYTRVRV